MLWQAINRRVSQLLKREASHKGLRWRATAADHGSRDVPEMPPCDVKPQPYKGHSFEEILKIRQNKLTPTLLPVTLFKTPVMIQQGHMQWLWDHNGKRYLDMFGGLAVTSVGHCHPKVGRALEDQAKLVWHATNFFLQPKVHEFAEQLTAKLPGDLKVVYFVNSGSEANDLAMLMARLYTGRLDIISLRNAYHGGSPNLMGLTSLSMWRYPVPVTGILQTMSPDPFRGPWGGANCRDSPVQTLRSCHCPPGSCEAGDKYVEQLEDVLRFSVPKAGIAGFFTEPIQGAGGTVQFPRNYLKKAFDIVRGAGGLCISDEVQTGFGRTGDHYWGFEGHGVTPDIVTMAKAIGNGFPLAAVVTTPEVAASMDRALHFNTFGGSSLACAVGSAVMEVIEEDRCQETSRDVGTYFLTELAKLQQQFDIIGDVRGKGLVIGVELVKSQATRDPLPVEEGNEICEACKHMGLLIGKAGVYGNVLMFRPPMCITKADVDFAVAVLRKAFQSHKDRA